MEKPPDAKNKKPRFICVYDNPLFMEKRLEDSEEGMLAQIRFKLPKDGTRDFTISFADLNGKSKFDVLSKYGIVVERENQKGEIVGYLNAWLKYLEKT